MITYFDEVRVFVLAKAAAYRYTALHKIAELSTTELFASLAALISFYIKQKQNRTKSTHSKAAGLHQSVASRCYVLRVRPQHLVVLNLKFYFN